jgi:hypothetical protein
MFKSRHSPVFYLKQLRGKKHLIQGNHEKWTKHVNLHEYFETVNQYKEITDSNHLNKTTHDKDPSDFEGLFCFRLVRNGK